MSRYRTLLVALATASSSAWTFQSSFAGRSVATTSSATTRFAASTLYLPSPVARHSHMRMFFGNLFSFLGGSSSNTSPFGAIKTIDYKTLDHPSPELASWAEQNLAPPATSLRDPHLSIATFAGGCFWGLELAFQRVPGVAYTAVGYTHGRVEAPSYALVCSGTTQHTEAVIVYYDPKECSYEQLLDVFFSRIDPTQVNRQGNDRGTQYRTGVYFHSPEQERMAKIKFENVAGNYRRPIATELKAAKPFWPAERYHQQYLEKGGQDASKGATERIRCYG